MAEDGGIPQRFCDLTVVTLSAKLRKFQLRSAKSVLHLIYPKGPRALMIGFQAPNTVILLVFGP